MKKSTKEMMLIQGNKSTMFGKRNREELHKAIDDQLARRGHSLKHAVKIKDTSMQWDLIAAAVEAAVINVFNLGKEDAETMRGGSNIIFRKNPRAC